MIVNMMFSYVEEKGLSSLFGYTQIQAHICYLALSPLLFYVLSQGEGSSCLGMRLGHNTQVHEALFKKTYTLQTTAYS